MNIVLHTCCAPCLAAAYPPFADLGSVLAFFYNPNVHPYVEFSKRLNAVRILAERDGIPCELHQEYGLRRFLEVALPDDSERCTRCRRERLGRATRRAAELHADAFSTTLLASVHQDHDALRAAGEQAEAEAGVPFLYRDLRSRAPDGLARARKLSLYCQQYCGCVFSEYDRYGRPAGEAARADA